ncbi:OmpH family outer membrane protein [Jannaschia formosa]|nr:OmpH family outer membrane protein [Jannaschia formosa]
MLAGPAWAEGSAGGLSSGVASSSVVVLDRDLLFTRSLFGQRIVADIEAASIALAAENRSIEAELEAEERALTARREEMEPDAFRALATAFDEKVTGIRQTQDAKARSLQQRSDRAQALFFERANPVLIELVQEIGALVILDRRIVIAAADRVDITTLARERIDTALGEGEGLGASEPAPPPAPEAPAAD